MTDPNKSTTIHKAARENDELNIRHYISLSTHANQDLNIVDKDGFTALHCACMNGHFGIVTLLLSANANIDSVHPKFGTPIYGAIKKNNYKIVQLLISKGSNIHFRKQDESLKKGCQTGWTPLHFASRYSSSEIVKLLCDAPGADINVLDVLKSTSLSIAVANSRVENVKMLIKKGADVKTVNLMGFTQLHAAAGRGNFDMIETLVNEGALLDAQDAEGDTPLFIAIRTYGEKNKGKRSAISYLLEKGAKVNIVNKCKQTPLHIATEMALIDIVRMLVVNCRANVNLIDSNGQTPLQIAINDVNTTDFSTEIVKILCKGGAKIDDIESVRLVSPAIKQQHVKFEPDGKRTSLHKIMFPSVHVDWELDTPIKSLLMDTHCLEKGPNFSLKNHFIPLHYAALNGHKNTLICILEEEKLAKRDTVNSLNHFGTPLVNALLNGHHHLVQILISYGADVNILSTQKDYPLDIASRTCRDKIEVHWQLIIMGAKYSRDFGDQVRLLTREAFRSDKHFKEVVLSRNYSFVELAKVHSSDLWFALMQSDIGGAKDLIVSTVRQCPEMAKAQDTSGRLAIDIATYNNRKAVLEMSQWFGRYRVTSSKPEHVSATCFVFKAVDESTEDENGSHPHVALKLMRNKSQFIHEVSTREAFNFDPMFVVNVLAAHPFISELTNNHPELVPMEEQTTTDSILTREEAERLYCVVLPLADRNMFVALKQERFTGSNVKDFAIVKFVFKQFLECVKHMHSVGILHGDLKTLNIVRVGNQWKLIDLDASCRIGVETVGSKSSSAYVPPEAILTNANLNIAVVLSESVAQEHGCAPLIAHSSFDVWSLGCLLFQMCNVDDQQLFAANQDDNLSDDNDADDNSLWALAEWSDELKSRRLTRVKDVKARNLLSLMLTKDPVRRPTIARILQHPFLSGKQNVRMSGDKAKYDVFISYRVASDVPHAELLYQLLIEQGVKVWWDKKRLQSGENWEKSFCAGLVDSKTVVCLISRDAVNSTQHERQNLSRLREDSSCDNVVLEHTLALELKEMGYVEKIMPVFIGELVNGEYERFQFGLKWHKEKITVKEIEDKLQSHMSDQGLGTPIRTDRSVQGVFNELTALQGSFVTGPTDIAFVETAQKIKQMLNPTSFFNNLESGGNSPMSAKSPMASVMTRLRSMVYFEDSSASGKGDDGGLMTQVASLRVRNDTLLADNAALKTENEQLLTELEQYRREKEESKKAEGDVKQAEYVNGRLRK